MKAEELEHAAFIPRFSRPQMLTLLGIVFAGMRSYALLLISLLIILMERACLVFSTFVVQFFTHALFTVGRVMVLVLVVVCACC
jgi:hypothetical protein